MVIKKKKKKRVFQREKKLRCSFTLLGLLRVEEVLFQKNDCREREKKESITVSLTLYWFQLSAFNFQQEEEVESGLATMPSLVSKIAKLPCMCVLERWDLGG